MKMAGSELYLATILLGIKIQWHLRHKGKKPFWNLYWKIVHPLQGDLKVLQKLGNHGWTSGQQEKVIEYAR